MVQHVYDGSVSFGGGQNAGILPENINPDQFYKAVNITTKTGGISPRPGFLEVPIEITEDITIDNLSASRIFTNGKFQCAAPYETDEGRYIIFVVSGVIFKVDPKSGIGEVLELADGDRINQYKNRIHWTQAGRFLVLFDWPSDPVIIDKDEARRADPNRTEPTLGTPQPEVPPAVLGTFVQNRLWIGNEGSEFTAGDPIGPGFPDAPITFEEVLVPSQPYYLQFFSLGSQSINTQITAMGFLQIPDTSTGYGPLFVATKDAIYTYAANTPRTGWENSSFGKLTLFNAGIAGPRGYVQVNSDLIFMDSFGAIRSLTSSRQEQQKWGNSSISREVEIYTKTYNRELLTYSFIERFENRVFASVQPAYCRAFDTYGKQTIDICHQGLIVLELNNINGLIKETYPAWAGLWTGVRPLEMIRGKDYIYIFSKDFGVTNRLYKVVEDAGVDIENDVSSPIVSRVDTKAYTCNSPFMDKLLADADYTLENISGRPFKFKAEYKSEGTNWANWRVWEHTAKDTTCSACCNSLNIRQKHNFRNVKLGDPEEKVCNVLTGDLGTTFRKMMLRLTFEGRDWLLKQIRLKAEANPEVEAGDVQCDDLVGKEVLKSCSEVSDFNLEANRDVIFDD